MAQPTIRLEGDYRTDRTRQMVKASTVIEAGDLLYSSGGYAYKVSAASHDAKFIGVAYESSSSTESASITVLQKCIVEIDVASASYVVGSGLKYSAANKLADDGGANTIAWVWERNTAATRLKVLIDAVQLGKFFENNA